MLPAQAQMALFWGADYVALYNDAYAATIGDKHPRALGRPAVENWAELWDDFEPLLRGVRETGQTFFAKDRPFYMERRGYGETAHFDVSCSPVFEQNGAIGGVLCVVSETTERVRAERALRDSEARLRFLSELDEALRASFDAPLAMRTATQMLARRLGATRCAYADVDADNDSFVIRGDYSISGVASSQGAYSLDLFGPRAAADMRRGHTLVIRDVPAELAAGEGRDMFQSINIDAIICCPLIKGGRLVAMMAVHQDRPRDWRADEIELVEAAVERCWAHVERVGAQARLRESEAFTRRILRSSADCIKVLDEDGRIEFMSDGGMRVMEVDDFDQIAGTPWPDLWQAEDRAKARAALEAARRGGTGHFQGLAATMKGRLRWWDVVVTPMPRARGGSEKLLSVSRDITATKQAEEALRASEERFRAALTIETVGAIFFDPEGKLTDANDTFLKMSGHTRADLETGELTWRRLTPPEWIADSERAFAELKEHGVTTPYEKEYVRKDGSRWWGLFAAKQLPDGEFFEFVLDITERKKVEARIRELNETLERRVAERTAERDRAWTNSRDLLAVLDTGGRYRAVNPAWAMILGYDHAELLGRSFVEFTHPDDVAKSWRSLTTAASEGLNPCPVRKRHKDGSYRWISWVAAPEGEFIYATGRDVTADMARQAELAAAEAARREADALYRAYFEHTAEALFVVNVLGDGGFSVEDLNPAHQANIGLRLADVRGKRLDEILPPPLAAQVASHYRRVITSGEVYQYSETFELNGAATYWDTVLVPVRDAAGHIVRIIGASRNLTAQRAAEEQLRQSQKLEAMGQLTGGVAHDFNNLLTPIIGSLDMLMRRGVGSERERRMIDGALQSAERAKTLVQRLLAFARRQPLQPIAVNLRTLVEGMQTLIGSTLGPQIDVRIQIAADLPAVMADANQLEMAVLNLALNARDAMPDGGALTIAAKRDSVRATDEFQRMPGQYVLLCVSDNGVGMDEPTRARAVEPFFSTKGIGKGTGLGLSMVHGLVAQLGGELTIASAPGMGTTIELRLPVSPEPAEAAGAHEGSSENRPRRGSALLVDDDDLVRMSTADMLIDLGFDVMEADSAESALSLIEGGATVDLLLTDHLMPGMTGADLARKLRAERPDVPVLIVSGYAEAEGVAPDLPRLIKPFRNAELLAKLDEIALTLPRSPE